MRRETLKPWAVLPLMMAVTVGCQTGDGARGSFATGASGASSVGESTDTDVGETDDGDTEAGGESGESGAETGGTPGGGDNDEGKAYIEEAKKEFPTYEDIHVKVIQRTCTPFQNVCHNNKEYPDLRTPQGVIDRIGRPCNLNELYNDPEAVFNACETAGDFLRFTDGANTGFSVEIGSVTVADDGMGGGTGAISLRDPIPAAMLSPATLESATIERLVGGVMQPVGSITTSLSYAQGALTVQVNNNEMFATHAEVLSAVTVGDPNGDGIFGASDENAMQEIKPGDPWNSYLLQRLQGNVPGSPMPLANQPLSASEIIAVACWIEGTADEGGAETDSVIDYDNCEYAAELATPPDGGGATLSEHVQPIFDQSCAFAGCHSTNSPAAGLDLSPGKSRAALLDIASEQNPDVPLVTAVNPTNSYLMVKVTGAGVSGQRMPLNGDPLSESQLEVLRTWIIQGAPDN
ncbi:MAG: hypothetical protein AAGA54_14870 [Myxococcota bacterium]